MPKLANKTTRITSSLIDQLKIRVSISERLTDEDIRIVLHDLRSSTSAFNMMVEDLALDPENLTSPRKLTKFHQLQEHALTAEKIVGKICDAISTERK